MTQRAFRNRGFSLVEVMLVATMLVMGLLAVISATTTESMVHRRSIQEGQVFEAMTRRAEWVRGELFRSTALQTAVTEALTGGNPYTAQYIVDADNDGTQDLSRTPGDRNTPILTVVITAPAPTNDRKKLLEVDVSASWYGIGGQRTASISTLVANRNGYGG